ncbi:hypothetical protein [Petrachloros mirabilis]|jgi:hypothetical protein
MKARKWMMEYGVAISLAVIFAAVLGHLPLFRETTVGKLHASDLVQFLGYSGALTIAWLGARQLALEPPENWKWLTPYRALILPGVTLITITLGYGVLLYVCQPFLGKFGKSVYNWLFIIGIVGASGWFIWTWVQKCVPEVVEAEPRRPKKLAA